MFREPQHEREIIIILTVPPFAQRLSKGKRSIFRWSTQDREHLINSAQFTSLSDVAFLSALTKKHEIWSARLTQNYQALMTLILRLGFS